MAIFILFVSPNLENCLSFIGRTIETNVIERKERVNRRLKKAIANSFHDDVTRGGGGEIFSNLLYSFSNVTVLKTFHPAFYISWPLRFLRKFLSSTLCQTFPPRIHVSFLDLISKFSIKCIIETRNRND